MKTKKYTSYAQIELDLEILKVERELNLKRIFLNVEKAKENLLPINLIKEIFWDYKLILSNSFSMILNLAIPLIFNWFTKKKRGN